MLRNSSITSEDIVVSYQRGRLNLENTPLYFSLDLVVQSLISTPVSVTASTLCSSVRQAGDCRAPGHWTEALGYHVPGGLISFFVTDTTEPANQQKVFHKFHLHFLKVFFKHPLSFFYNSFFLSQLFSLFLPLTLLFYPQSSRQQRTAISPPRLPVIHPRMASDTNVVFDNHDLVFLLEKYCFGGLEDIPALLVSFLPL